MKIVSDPSVAEFVAGSLGIQPVLGHGPPSCIGISKDGVIKAGVLYSSNNGYNIHAHIASDGSKRWLNRTFLFAMFHYPFMHLGIPRITVTVSASNIASRNLAERLGFTYEATLIEAANDGDDLVVYRMFRDECRHI